ncbi:MAG: rhomboid family intramembrane serine protease [Blastopirellula sp.]|nr:MAG: rhomboid family intramembrane serine protease [Blastopirellula sp.]
MGFSDRDYNREESQGFSFGGGSGSSTRSIVNTLLIINIGVFLVDWIVGGGNLGHWFAASDQTITRPWLWYQFLTYGFLHDTRNIWHIVMNMFVLWMFGRQVEAKYGPKEFLRFYLVTIIFGGFGYSLFYFLQGSSTSVIGASGAVTGVLILFICSYPKQTLLIYGVFPVPAWIVGVFIVGSDIYGSFDEKSTTAHSVHLAGVAIALAYFYGGWNFSRIMPNGISIPKQWFKRGPKLKVHSPDVSNRYAKDDQRGDELLAKVDAHGIDSLTTKERKQLDAYSRRMKQKHR